jgi:hypothetical protein
VTTWPERALPEVPIDHPWPDQARAWFHLLDGEWGLALDPADRGVEDAWYEPEPLPDPFYRVVPVPIPREAPAANREARTEGPDTDPAEGITTAWVRRRFTVPEGWLTGSVALVFLGVDWRARVWVNGQEVGAHEGAYTAFELDVTDAVGAGDNLVVVRIEDDGAEDGAQLVGLQGQDGYPAFSGIWRSVYAEHRGPAWSGRVDVRPRLDPDEIELSFGLSGDLARVDLVEVAVARPDGGQDRALVVPEGKGVSLSLPLTDARRWSPEDPYVYQAAVRLFEGEALLDEQLLSFGLREVSTGWCPGGAPEELTREDDPNPHGCLHVNGAPVYLRAASMSTFHPSLLAACTAGRCRLLLEQAHALGLNALLVRGTVLPPADLQIADHLGLMLLAEVPGLPTHAEDALGAGGAQAYEWMADDLIRRDRAHPSVIGWSLFREGGGVLHPPFWLDAATKDWVAGRFHRAREVAPELVFQDNLAGGFSEILDGSLPHVVTDIQGYVSGPRRAAELSTWLDELLAGVLPGSAVNFFGARTQAGEPALVAGLACSSGNAPVRVASGCLPALMNEVRQRPGLAGFAWAALCDTPLGLPGLLTASGNEKRYGYDSQGLSLPDLLGEDFVMLASPLLREATPGEEVTVGLGVSTGRPGARPGARLRAALWLDQISPTGHAVRRALLEEDVEIARALRFGPNPIDSFTTILPEEGGIVTLHVSLRDEHDEVQAANHVQWIIEGGGDAADPEGHDPDEVVPLGTAVDGVWSEGWGPYNGYGYRAGRGIGHFKWRAYMPDGFDPEQVEKYAVVFEAASNPDAWPLGETDTARSPTQGGCRLNQGPWLPFRAEDAPADARGVLSALHAPNLGWAYGEVVRVDFPPYELGTQSWGYVMVECGIQETSVEPNGLRVFDERHGALPLKPALLVWYD